MALRAKLVQSIVVFIIKRRKRIIPGHGDDERSNPFTV